MPVSVQEAVPQCLQHPHASVIGRAPSDPDNKLSASLADPVPDHLSHSIGSRIERIPSLLRHKDQTGSLRHLDHCSPRLFDHAIPAGDRVSKRFCHLYFPDLSVSIADQGVNRSFPAVRQRPHRYLCRRIGAEYPTGCRISRFQGSHASLKRINHCKYFHLFPPRLIF